jgi:aminopeptidase N
MRALDMTNDDIRNAAQPILVSLVQTDKNTLAQAAAIGVLGNLKISGNIALYKQALNSQSYAVEGAALGAIAAIDPSQALPLTKRFEKDNSPALTIAIMRIFAASGNDSNWPTAYILFTTATGQGRFGSARSFATFIGKLQNPAYVQQGITALLDLGIKFKAQPGVSQFITTVLQNIKTARAKLNDNASAQAADNALKTFKEAK